MAKKKKTRDNFIYVGKVKMSVEERNRLMKLDYVNGGLSLKEIGEKYGLAYGTVRILSCNEGWKEYKDKYKEKVNKDVEKKIQEMYVLGGVEINLMYNNAWQELLHIIYEAIRTREGLLNKDGKLDMYRLNQLADVLTKAQNGQHITTGFIGREALAKIELQEKQYTLREALADVRKVGEDEQAKDNFMHIMEDIAKKLVYEEDEVDGDKAELKE